MKHAYIEITWGKSYGDPYCHHAVLTIPSRTDSFFLPEVIQVGVTIRTNTILKKKVKSSTDTRSSFYLPYVTVPEGFSVQLNSSQLIDALSLCAWTSLNKGKERGTLKQFPVNLFYQIDTEPEVVLPFNFKNGGSPYMQAEDKLKTLADGELFVSTINFG